MPILIKKIEAEIISLFGGTSNKGFMNLTAPVNLVQKFVGEIGIEDYVELETYVGFVQDFSNVTKSRFYENTPEQHGLGECLIYEDLKISY